MNLSDDVANALLDRLSTDDAFRATFSKDPRAALAEVGHAPARDSKVSDGSWACMQVTALASKEEIARSRETLHRMLVAAKGAHQPIALESSGR